MNGSIYESFIYNHFDITGYLGKLNFDEHYFFLFNAPFEDFYVFMNLYPFLSALNEFITLDLIQKSLTNECRVVKFWILVFGSVSQTLLSFNSSINFLLYPAISKDFRHICKVYFKTKFPIIEKLITKHQSNEHYTEEDAEVGSRILARPQSTELLQSGNLLGPDDMNREIFVLEEISNHTHQDIVAVYQEGNGEVVTSSSRRSSRLYFATNFTVKDGARRGRWKPLELQRKKPLARR